MVERTAGPSVKRVGEWINKLCNENKKIYKLVKKYGEEYYREEGIIYHGGGMLPFLGARENAGTAKLRTNLNKNITITMMSSDGGDASHLYNMLFIFNNNKNY